MCYGECLSPKRYVAAITSAKPSKSDYALGINFMFDTLSLSFVYLVIKLGEFFFFCVFNEKKKLWMTHIMRISLRDLAPHFRGGKKKGPLFSFNGKWFD